MDLRFLPAEASVFFQERGRDPSLHGPWIWCRVVAAAEGIDNVLLLGELLHLLIDNLVALESPIDQRSSAVSVEAPTEIGNKSTMETEVAFFDEMGRRRRDSALDRIPEHRFAPEDST